MSKIERFSRLQHLYELYGNSPETGYINNAIEIKYDEEKSGEQVYFISTNTGEKETVSEGIVLPNSILIMQRVKSKEREDNHFYIWDDTQGDENMKYTYLKFDNVTVMTDYFEKIRGQDPVIKHSDIAESFKEMGLEFGNIKGVLTFQRLNPLEEMLKEEGQDDNKPTFAM